MITDQIRSIVYLIDPSNTPPPDGSTGLDMRVIPVCRDGQLRRRGDAGRGRLAIHDLGLVRTSRPGGGEVLRLGHRLLDDYLDVVAARARPNTALATAFDLKVFFSVVAKEPEAVTAADVLDFLRVQRRPRRGIEVVRLEDGEAGQACLRLSGLRTV